MVNEINESEDLGEINFLPVDESPEAVPTWLSDFEQPWKQGLKGDVAWADRQLEKDEQRLDNNIKTMDEETLDA